MPTRVIVTAEGSQALLLVNVTSGAVERVFKTETAVSHMLALSTDRTRLYCSNMRDGSVSAFDFKTGAKIKDVQDRQGMRGRGRDARRPLGVGRQPRRRHHLDHRHADARGDQADSVARLPLPRAVHARRQARARPARASVVAGRGRRRHARRS